MVADMIIKNKMYEGDTASVKIMGVTFVNCKFKEGASYTKFKDCIFTNCTFSNYELMGKIKACSFVNCKFNNIEFHCDLTSVSFNGGIANGCFFDGVVILMYTYNTKFTDCRFYTNGGIFDSGSTFKNCTGMLYKYEQVTILEDGL